MDTHIEHDRAGRPTVTLSAREQIMLAALLCFTEKGYHGTSVRDIATRVGLSVPGLYHHFDSKMELLENLMNDTMDDLLAGVRNAYESAGPDALDRFEAVVESHVRFHCERQEESFLGNSELRSLPQSVREQLIAKRDEVEYWFELPITEGVQIGIFHTERTHETARALASMCVAVAFWYQADGDLSADEVVEIYRDLGLQLLGHW